MDLHQELAKLKDTDIIFENTSAEGLNVDYAVVLSNKIADAVFEDLENTLEYYDGDLTKVRVFAKWHEIPRQQVAHGDPTTVYRFSGVTLPAKEWTPTLKALRDMIATITGVEYNFVLINRYRNGSDRIGEHKDGEAELDPNAPIASLSLGQPREFVLKHGDVRKKGSERRDIPLVKLQLEHGSLLLMNPPTNKFWYHSLPPRKKASGVRINLTFRRLIK